MSTPKILSVVSYTAYSVQTDADDFPHFTRHSAENWTQTMGESEEPVYNCAELEKSFQAYVGQENTRFPVKIVQIVVTPNDPNWQGSLLGLGDDGNVYREHGGSWEVIIHSPV